jgi:glutamate-1-semialdehyde 2,1-aminomutase
MFALGYWPGYYEKAKGSEVWDLDGNRFVDMSIGGIGANVLGYADPDVNAAVKRAIEDGSSCSLNCPEEVELADLLCKIHPWAEKVRFARSGGESMAMAVRIARAYAKKDKIAFCGYHGWHDWYLAANLATESALNEHLLPGLNPAGVPKVLAGTVLPFSYNNLEELKIIARSYGREIGAIVMEPIRSNDPNSGFLEGVREIANQIKAVLVIDEISAGFRLTDGGAHLVLNLEPDIAVFSKAMGNGFPIGAVIGKSDVMEAAQETFISSTMFTERIGPTAALATIKKFSESNVSAHLMRMGKRVQAGWGELAKRHGIEILIGGIAPLAHFALLHEKAMTMKALFIKLMLQKGFLASNLFYAMYTHQDQHVESYLEAADETFLTIADSLKDGSLEKRLNGPASTVGFKRLA